MINSVKVKTFYMSMLTVFIVGSFSVNAADNLGNVLYESGWIDIIGTWVDEATMGAKMKVTYTWRFKNQVMEIDTEEGHKKNISFMGYNTKKREVFHFSFDNYGGSSIGRWIFKHNEAILRLMFITGTGDEGILEIQHRIEDEEKLVVSVNLPDPIIFTMIRVKK